MIKLGKKEIKQIITNEELDWLADRYIKLQQSPEYLRLKKQFKDFIDDYLDQELLEANLKPYSEDNHNK